MPEEAQPYRVLVEWRQTNASLYVWQGRAWDALDAVYQATGALTAARGPEGPLREDLVIRLQVGSDAAAPPEAP